MRQSLLIAGLLLAGPGTALAAGSQAAGPGGGVPDTPAETAPGAETAGTVDSLVVTADTPDASAVIPEAPGAAAGDDLLFQRERYFYASFARRDPFASLLKGGFMETEGDLLDIGEITLVGVVWGEDDKFAVVEDKRERVHTMRVGDRVVNGKVIEITKTSLTVQHYFFGETANVTIHIQQGEGADEKP
jgi:hypothetical protein